MKVVTIFYFPRHMPKGKKEFTRYHFYVKATIHCRNLHICSFVLSSLGKSKFCMCSSPFINSNPNLCDPLFIMNVANLLNRKHLHGIRPICLKIPIVCKLNIYPLNIPSQISPLFIDKLT